MDCSHRILQQTGRTSVPGNLPTDQKIQPLLPRNKSNSRGTREDGTTAHQEFKALLIQVDSQVPYGIFIPADRKSIFLSI